MSIEQNLTADDLRVRSIRGGATTFVAQGAKFLLMLASQVVMARLLAPADFGLVALAGPVIAFLALFSDLGLLQAVVQRRSISQAEVSTIFWVNAVLSMAVAACCAGTSVLMAWLYGDPRLIAVVLALSGSIVVTGLSQVQVALANRALRFTLLAAIEVASLAASVAAGVVAAWAGWGYWALVASQLVAVAAGAVLIWFFSPWRPSRPASLSAVGHLLRFGGHITATKVIGYLNQSCDNILVGTVLGQGPLGIYDRAYKLAVLPLAQLTAPLERIAIPTLSRLREDDRRYRAACARMLQAMLLTTSPAFAFAGLTATPLIALVFGPAWSDMAPTFAWICAGALITPVNMLAFWIFVSQGRSREQMRVFALVSVINVAAYAIGLAWGLAGVARCSALSVYLLQTPILLRCATRSGPMPLRAVLRAMSPVVAGLVAGSATLAAFLRLHPVATFFDLAACGAVLYAALLLVVILSLEGRRMMGSFWSFRRDLAG